LASAAKRCQDEQEVVLYQALTKLLSPIPPDISASVVKFAKDIIDRSTFGNSVSVLAKLRHAAGPRGGKSTFLRVLSNALVCRSLRVANTKRRF
jgi:hypothetical protein